MPGRLSSSSTLRLPLSEVAMSLHEVANEDGPDSPLPHPPLPIHRLPLRPGSVTSPVRVPSEEGGEDDQTARGQNFLGKCGIPTMAQRVEPLPRSTRDPGFDPNLGCCLRGVFT